MTQQHRRWHDSTYISRSSAVASVAPSPTWLGSTVASITQHLHHAVAKSHRQCHRQHDSATPSPAWLDIYTTPSLLDIYTTPLLAWLGSTVISMTWYLHNTIASMTRQHCGQHDSVSTMHRNQVDSIAPSPAPSWCPTYPPWSTPSHRSSRSSGCDVEEEAKQCHLWTMSRKMLGKNKVTYIVYKEW
jgi:hypothetical protein